MAPTSSSPPAQREKGLVPARTCPGAWIVLLSVILAGLALDLWSKREAFEHVADTPVLIDRSQVLSNPAYNPIPQHDSVIAIPGRLLNFHLVLNSGAVFGIGANQRWFFIIFSVVAVGLAVWIFGWRTDARSRWLHVGIAMILAGALGNLWDRVVLGRVRDFLHMLPDRTLPFGLTWPSGDPQVWPWIFNVADVLLLAGMAIVLIHMHLEDRRLRRTQRATASTEPVPTGSR